MRNHPPQRAVGGEVEGFNSFHLAACANRTDMLSLLVSNGHALRQSETAAFANAYFCALLNAQPDAASFLDLNLHLDVSE